MNLFDIVHGQRPPKPWAEGDNIPWHDPAFSERMLKEHLSQAHDRASRRLPKIDRHVDWIHRQVLGSRPSRVLDLACGPGLYSSRLARLGHRCTGIDYSPASIRYAEEESQGQGDDCEYVLADIREADYGGGYDLVMLLFGELNVFRRTDARAILGKAHRALTDGGQLLLELHTYGAVKEIGDQGTLWHRSRGGLFSPEPHLLLLESNWDGSSETTTQRYWVVDAATGRASRFSQTMQAYTRQRYRQLLEECGFRDMRVGPSLLGEPDAEQLDLLAILARKP